MLQTRTVVMSSFAAALLLLLSYSNVNGQVLNTTPGALCTRTCGNGQRLCYFDFTLERYAVLNPACRNCSRGVRADCLRPQCVPADGFKKSIVTINRQIPAPSIQVCRNDIIIVNVHNHMFDLSTTLHWHGFRQLRTPYMDGVPMVTQCPILPDTSFQYAFKAEEAGTFFYHSHMGTQKIDRLSGPLIVRDVKSNEVYGNLYDEDRPDHVIILQDWMHPRGDDFLPGRHIESEGQIPNSVLINGFGSFTNEGNNTFVPMANFTVRSGVRYRFRLIGDTCNTCSFAFRIEGHRLLAIAADGGLSFEPRWVDTISLNSADRFDFIFHANQTIRNYRIFVRGLDFFCDDVWQVGTLRYETATNVLGAPQPLPIDAQSLGVILNPTFSTCNNSNTNELCTNKLRGLTHAPSVSNEVNEQLYRQFRISFGEYNHTIEDLFAPGTYQTYEEPVYNLLKMSTMSGVSFRFPPSPLISQGSDIPPSVVCNSTCKAGNLAKPCACTNVDFIPLGAIVDLIVYHNGERYGDTYFNHPFHIHGFNFYVLAVGLLPERFADRPPFLNRLSDILRNDDIDLTRKPMRDTVTVPARGYALLRFYADNPGFWLLHCHFLYHFETGMGRVFKVGENYDIPPIPPRFPRCGNFQDNATIIDLIRYS